MASAIFGIWRRKRKVCNVACMKNPSYMYVQLPLLHVDTLPKNQVYIRAISLFARMYTKDAVKNIRANCPFARISLFSQRESLHAKCHLACRDYEVFSIRIQAICQIARTISPKTTGSLQAACLLGRRSVLCVFLFHCH